MRRRKKSRWFYKIQRQEGVMGKTARSCREETVISRLRFGHSGLNSTLFKTKKHISGNCDFCDQQETTEHAVLYCPRHEVERREFILKMRLDSSEKCYNAL